MMKNLLRMTTLTLAFLLVSACSGVMDSKQAPRQTYLLNPVGSSAAAAPESAPSLALEVSVVPGLDTDRILALGPDASLSPYANARWPDHLPEVINSVMKRSLESSGRFSSVEISSRARDDGWQLALELQQFYGIRSGSGETSSVRIELAGSIKCNQTSTVVNLSDSNSVSQERLSSVVAAHQRGLDNVTQQLLQQIDSACS